MLLTKSCFKIVKDFQIVLNRELFMSRNLLNFNLNRSCYIAVNLILTVQWNPVITT